ncbi:MAG TPA: hypothetical protein VFG04_16470 [Planctomycetaceae bacterium]|nr:hypothetical protein [Planctomycetaceae bacterium]
MEIDDESETTNSVRPSRGGVVHFDHDRVGPRTRRTFNPLEGSANLTDASQVSSLGAHPDEGQGAPRGGTKVTDKAWQRETDRHKCASGPCTKSLPESGNQSRGVQWIGALKWIRECRGYGAAQARRAAI